MIRPLSNECDASITKPVGAGWSTLLILLPSTITRAWASLPTLASRTFGMERTYTGSAVGSPPTVVVWTRTPAFVPPVRPVPTPIRPGMAWPARAFRNVMVKDALGAGPPETTKFDAPRIGFRALCTVAALAFQLMAVVVPE